MENSFQDLLTGGLLKQICEADDLNERVGALAKHSVFYLCWNRGDRQEITIEGEKIVFPSNSILPLSHTRRLRFSAPRQVILWIFNDEFLISNYANGIRNTVTQLFLKNQLFGFIPSTAEDDEFLKNIYYQIRSELSSEHKTKALMLQSIFSQLLIYLERKYKFQEHDSGPIMNSGFKLFRAYVALVYEHYREEHSVSFYAAMLNKSPKTITNVFKQFGDNSPKQIIQNKILTEARRLLLLTDKSAKEISIELGFDDIANFTNFFTRKTGLGPVAYRKLMAERTPSGELHSPFTITAHVRNYEIEQGTGTK